MLLDPISYIHGQYSLIHQDVKPASIYSDEARNIKLKDFAFVANKFPPVIDKN